MSLQLLTEINNNYQVAIAVHREMADTFWFISMPGYAMIHEYQYLDESMAQRNIKRYTTTTYHTILPDKLPKTVNIVEPLLGDRNRKALKMEDTWKIIQETFRIYQEWEESTLKEYQRIARELVANGDISTFNFVGELIKDVKVELVFLTDKIIELTAHNFDMPTVVSEQAEIMERYEYKIRNLLGKSKEYHHFNSMHDAESRLAVLDK